MIQQGFTGILGDMALSPTIDAVRAYQTESSNGQFRCDLTRCPHCGTTRKSGMPFHRHTVRERDLRVTVRRLVYRFVVKLARWRCPVCRTTFTNYPPFMLRHKRYALPEMRARAARYVQDDGLSYRRAVTESSMPIFHGEIGVADSGSSEHKRNSEAIPILSHTTLFRWVTTLGIRLPPSAVEKEEHVAPQKSRTPARKRLLAACLSVCRAN